MIHKIGETVTIPVEAEIIATFGHEDRVFYVARSLKSPAKTTWVVATDGQEVVLTPEILEKATWALHKK